MLARVVELQQFELRYGVALSCIDDGVMTTNQKGVVLFINPAAERILGRQLVEVGQQTFQNLFEWRTADQSYIDELMQHLANGTNWSSLQPLELELDSDSSRLVEISTSPLRDAEQKTAWGRNCDSRRN